MKSVHPTEIRAKRIALEAIKQIYKPIPESVYCRNREFSELVKTMTYSDVSSG